MHKLYKIYAQTGKTPKEVLRDAERNPSIIDDLENSNKIIPDEYANTKHIANVLIHLQLIFYVILLLLNYQHTFDHVLNCIPLLLH